MALNANSRMTMLPYLDEPTLCINNEVPFFPDWNSSKDDTLVIVISRMKSMEYLFLYFTCGFYSKNGVSPIWVEFDVEDEDAEPLAGDMVRYMTYLDGITINTTRYLNEIKSNYRNFRKVEFHYETYSDDQDIEKDKPEMMEHFVAVSAWCQQHDIKLTPKIESSPSLSCVSLALLRKEMEQEDINTVHTYDILENAGFIYETEVLDKEGTVRLTLFPDGKRNKRIDTIYPADISQYLLSVPSATNTVRKCNLIAEHALRVGYAKENHSSARWQQTKTDTYMLLSTLPRRKRIGVFCVHLPA